MVTVCSPRQDQPDKVMLVDKLEFHLSQRVRTILCNQVFTVVEASVTGYGHDKYEVGDRH